MGGSSIVKQLFFPSILVSSHTNWILFTKSLVCYTEDMTQEEEIAQLKEQLREVLELEKQKTSPPAEVSANVKKPPEGQRKQRKKRDPKHNHARCREKPTRIVEHRISTCPACSSRLGGVSMARRRPRD
jgi:hypothetical protein